MRISNKFASFAIALNLGLFNLCSLTHQSSLEQEEDVNVEATSPEVSSSSERLVEYNDKLLLLNEKKQGNKERDNNNYLYELNEAPTNDKKNSFVTYKDTNDQQDQETSASVLKLTRHYKPTANNVTNVNRTAPSNRQVNSSNHTQDNSLSRTNNKKNSNKSKLNFFNANHSAKKISLISLLPKSKRQDSQTQSSSTTTTTTTAQPFISGAYHSMGGGPNNNNQQQQQQQQPFDDFFSSGAIQAAHHHHHQMIPLPNGDFHHQASQHPLLFGSQQPPNMATSYPPPGIPPPLNHHHHQQQQNLIDFARHQAVSNQIQQQQQQQQQPQTVLDQAVAQSIEQQQKVRIGAHPNLSGGGQELPIFFAASSGSPTHGMNQHHQHYHKQQVTNDKTGAGISLIPAPESNYQQQQQQQQQKTTASLADAAAAALFSGRAKNLILGNKSGGFVGIKQQTNDSTNKNKDSGGNNNKMKTSASNSGLASGNNPAGLASMIKSAAEAWAATGVGPEATPTIILEHDGPSITTVDFNNFRGQRVINGDQDEDDDNSFYAEEDEESMGSNEAGRIARLKQHSNNLHQSQPQPQPQHQLLASHHGHHHGRQQQISPEAAEMFYQDQVRDRDQASELGSRRGIGKHTSILSSEGNGSPADDAVQDYLQFERVIDQQQPSPPSSSNNHQQQQQQHYPDSINAIKEQGIDNNNNDDDVEQNNNGRDGKQSAAVGGGLVSAVVRNKLSQEQIEQLIGELQDLNKRRKQGSGRSSGRNSNSNSNSNSNRRLRGVVNSSDDYDYDEDEDEQTRLLRKKLLSRLRNKHTGRRRLTKLGGGGDDSLGGNLDGVSSNHMIQDQAVKIPLHTLLMAALDRRMSPSEQSISQSASVVISPESRGGVLEVGDNLLTDGEQQQQQQHHHLVAASDLIGERPYNFLNTMFNSNQNLQKQKQEEQVIKENQPETEEFGNQGKNLSNSTTTTPTMAKWQVAVSTAAVSPSPSPFASAAVQRRNESSEPDHEPNGQSQTNTGRVESAADGGSIESTTTTASTSAEIQVPIATTPMPTIIQTRLSSQDGSINLNARSQNSKHNDGKGHREVASRRSDNEGDFDINNTVDEFARDDEQNQSLEPAWIQKKNQDKQTRASREEGGVGKRGLSPIDFDDDGDYDGGIKAASRSKGRKALKRNKIHSRLDNSAKDGRSEANIEANEDRFFNRLQRDTHNDDNDNLDKNLTGIEDPVEPGEEIGSNTAASSRHGQRRRALLKRPQGNSRANSPDDDDDDDEGGDGDGGSSSNSDRDDDGGGNSNDDDDSNNRKRRLEQSKTRSTWKPQLVDDEIRKIEEVAKQKEAAAAEAETRKDQAPLVAIDYPENEDDNETRRYEDLSESQTRETTVLPSNKESLTNQPPNQQQ